MKVFWILLIAFSACAEPLNEKYSYKAFPTHGLSFKDVDATEFNGTEIRGTCFYQEWQEGEPVVMKRIFPPAMTGVIFIGCNLDNVFIPPGNTVVGGINRGIKVQNDLDDWLVNVGGQPTEPTNKANRVKAGVSVDPADIPAEKITKEQKDANEKVLKDAQ